MATRQTSAIASVAEHTVSAIMRKPTAADRREAFFAAYNLADQNQRHALFGAVSILLARCDGIPPTKTEA